MEKDFYEKFANAKKEFIDEITKKSEELKELLNFYVEIYYVNDEVFIHIEEVLKLL